MKKILTSRKIMYLGIIIVTIQTLSGSLFDSTTKVLGSSNFIWYHYYTLGIGFALIFFLLYLTFTKGIKKHILYEDRKDYFLPLIRGITFIPVPIIIYYSLSKIPLNIFTTILMTTPFFTFICSNILQKEIISFKYWIILLIGFSGTILVAKPSFFQANPFIFLIFFVCIYNAITFVIVSKYSSKATTLGFSFYHLLPITLFSAIFFIFDPILISLRELILVFIGGTLLLTCVLLYTYAFHIAGKYTRIISPFFFTQLVWAAIFGYIFFGEVLDLLSITGLLIIVFSGTLTILNTPNANQQ